MNINRIPDGIYSKTIDFRQLKTNFKFDFIKRFSEDIFNNSKNKTIVSLSEKFRNYISRLIDNVKIASSAENIQEMTTINKVLRKSKLLNKKTNTYEDVNIIQKGCGLYSVNNQESELGYILLGSAGISCKGSSLENVSVEYKNNKFLEILFLQTNNNGNYLSNYKGIGKELVKQAVFESLKRGCEGRIALKCLNFKHSINSPDEFYKHIGLKFSGNCIAYNLYTMPEEYVQKFLSKA